MKRKLRTAFGLPAAERVLLGRAWVRLLWVGLALRFVPLPKVQSLLATAPRRPGQHPIPVSRLAWVVDAAARHHILALHCLQRSLVLQSLVEESGGKADLRIGVRRTENRMEAHAWVEQEGRALGDSLGLVPHYLPLDRI